MLNLIEDAVKNESRLVDTFSENTELVIETLDEFLARQDKVLRNVPKTSELLYFT